MLTAQLLTTQYSPLSQKGEDGLQSVGSAETDIYGLLAYSHHDRFPPWWVFVRDDNGGNLSGDKIPPLMMIIINHLTQFNSSH